MRIKTTVALPKELLARIDSVTKNRSAFIERASRVYLSRLERARRDAHDLAIMNTNAKRLNAEAADALEYQVHL
jgi:metal-responsive CopG/Arc/MetJ family transcriptional regulator